MTNSTSMLKSAVIALAVYVCAISAASAQILIVDDDRVEREAAAYKDFNQKTTDLRDGILQRRQFISRGGEVEQQLADLEKRKSAIGDAQYESRKKDLETSYVAAQRELQDLEYKFDRLRQEAMAQVEKARQPVIDKILADHNAEVIMLKRLVLGSKAGSDVTSEFIALLDARLPTVAISAPK